MKKNFNKAIKVIYYKVIQSPHGNTHTCYTSVLTSESILQLPQSYAQEKAATLFLMLWILQTPFPFCCLLNFGMINSQLGPNTMYGVDNLLLRKKSPKN